MKVIKKYSGNYQIYIDDIYVGSIDKLESNEWVCLDKYDRPFEMCNTKKYALTLFYVGVNV
jgi:hypothetical protein